MKHDNEQHQPTPTTSQQQTSSSKTKIEHSTANNLFCYEVGNFRIIIEPGITMEVLETSTIYPIPNAPKHYLGVTSLRGEILPVANMHVLLGLEEGSSKTRLLRLKHPEFSSLIIAINNLPYQTDVEKLSLMAQADQTPLPPWISAQSPQNHLTFLFADHALFFKKMQDEETI